MGYLHIDNLYKNQEILLFKECYALEKIHGTSAHIEFKTAPSGKGSMNYLEFFSGAVSHGRFVELFDEESLLDKFVKAGLDYGATIYGEAYGGSCQKMSNTYGKDLKFVAFDVKIGDYWLSVPQAEEFVLALGLEFVDYYLIRTTIEAMDAERDRPSIQAFRNCGHQNEKREGVVLRPLIELTKNNGKRVISKHKSDDFKETKTPRVVSPEKLQVLADATAIAEEWVTPMRISHVLDKMGGDVGMEDMREIMSAMCNDVQREAEGEIVWAKPVSVAIGKATAKLVKAHFQNKLQASAG